MAVQFTTSDTSLEAKYSVMTSDEVRDRPSPEWLVDGILPEHATILMYGFEGSHKSFIALDLAYCIASGTSWHGHQVKPGRVLYIAAEGGNAIGKRIRAWDAEHGITCNEVDWLMDEVLMLDSDNDAKEAALVWRDAGYTFVIFDTLRTSSTGNEMSPQVMNAITRSMRFLQRELNATVMVVHHSPKKSDDTYGGAAAMGTNITTNIRVSYDPNTGKTEFACKKQKDAEFFDTIAFKHKPVGESLVMTTDKGKKSVGKTNAHDATILKVLGGFPDGIAKADLRRLCTEAGVSKSSCYRRIGELQAQG